MGTWTLRVLSQHLKSRYAGEVLSPRPSRRQLPCRLWRSLRAVYTVSRSRLVDNKRERKRDREREREKERERECVCIHTYMYTRAHIQMQAVVAQGRVKEAKLKATHHGAKGAQCRNLIEKPWAFIRGPYMNPTISGL